MESNQNGTQTLVIKKYANRKFYNTETSQYVTLGQIRESVLSGRTVEVIHNVSKENITKATLLMSLVETESELTTSQVVDLIKASIAKKPKVWS